MKFVHVIYHLHPKKKKKKKGVQGNIESKYYTIFAVLRPLRWFINREVYYILTNRIEKQQ